MQSCLVVPDPLDAGRWRAHVLCASPRSTPVAERWIVEAVGYGVTMARAVGAAQAEAWRKMQQQGEPDEMEKQPPQSRQVEMDLEAATPREV
jgi:hypothetical protein